MKKVIDIEERIPSMREQRRRKTNRKFIFILTVFVLALLIILYFQSPLSQINKITVNGAKLHDASFYKEESGLLKNGPLWGFSVKEMEESLEEIDVVQSATVSRKGLRDVQVDISEWGTVAYIEEAGRYRVLLKSGEIFSDDSLNPEEEAPILNGFSDPAVQKRMVDQLLEMDKEVYQLISEVIYTGTADYPDNLKAYMDDGNEVRGIIPTFAEQMKYYPEMVAQLQGYEKGIIDIEVGTFFIPYSEAYGSGEEEGEESDEQEEE